MSKNEKTGLVPKLRFAEFRGSGDWERRSLNNIATMKARVGWQGLTQQEFLNDGDYYLITGIDFYNGQIDFKNCRYISRERYEQDQNIQIKNGDVLITKDGTIGKVAIVSNMNKPATLNAGVFVIRGKSIEINNSYLHLYLAAPYLLDYAKKKATGGTIKHLNQNVLIDFPIPMPEYSEQQKIADCLSSLNELITAEDKKLMALNAHKKGLMQKLFPAEGETVPELRYAEFGGSGEWEKTSFKQVFTKLQYGLNAAAKEYDGKNKYIRITDIDESSRRYLNEKTVSPDCDLDDNYLVRDGDILFARTGASTGKTYMYTANDGILYFAGFLIRGNVNEKYYPQFIFAQTLSTNYEKWVAVTSTRSGQPGINANEYESFIFACPSIPEQLKIADCLSSLDELITAQSQKIEALKLHKKGLMQGLFPSIEGAEE